MTFPADMRRAAGRELLLVQYDGEPTDWKPMKSIGAGVREIRLRDQSGAYRVIYVAKYENAVCVLHCFEKRSQKTDRRDIELAVARLRELHRR
jgi:phage-related protein